jgi:hypothetical protein
MLPIYQCYNFKIETAAFIVSIMFSDSCAKKSSHPSLISYHRKSYLHKFSHIISQVQNFLSENVLLMNENIHK